MDVFGRPVGIYEGKDENYDTHLEGKFSMSGGKISGNQATEVGGGIYDKGKLVVHGGVISDNNALEYNDVYSYNGNNGLHSDKPVIDEDKSNSKNVIKAVMAIVVIIFMVVVFFFFYLKKKTKLINTAISKPFVPELFCVFNIFVF